MKPFSSRNKKLAEAEAFFERENAEDDDEMRAELQKAFAARDARRKAANEDDDTDDAEPVKNEEAPKETEDE